MEESLVSRTHRIACRPPRTGAASLVLAARKLSTCSRSQNYLQTFHFPSDLRLYSPASSVRVFTDRRRAEFQREINSCVYNGQWRLVSEQKQQNTGSFSSAHRAQIATGWGGWVGGAWSFHAHSNSFTSSRYIPHSHRKTQLQKFLSYDVSCTTVTEITV